MERQLTSLRLKTRRFISLDEEPDFIEIDEETVDDIKWSIVKYVAVFIIFVFIPLMITILTSNSLSKLNVFAGFTGITIICIDQVISLARFIMGVHYEYDESSNIEDEEENN
jgi:uncharacterized membrane protein